MDIKIRSMRDQRLTRTQPPLASLVKLTPQDDPVRRSFDHQRPGDQAVRAGALVVRAGALVGLLQLSRPVKLVRAS